MRYQMREPWMLSSHHKRHDFFSYLRRSDVPITVGVFRSNKFTVVIEDHPAVGVPHFQREGR